MLYRDLAPISMEAWAEIDKRAEDVLKSYLSARKVVNVIGPKGLDYNVVSEGRLNKIEEVKGVYYGIFEVLPLTESRIEFEMERWELDNIARGAKDIDYEPLEKAMKEIALFEDNTIYNGLQKANIKGLNEYQGTVIPFGKDPTAIMEAITLGIIKLRNYYEASPYSLIVNEEAYKRIISKETAYPLDKRIETLIDGKIILSKVINGAYLLPYNHSDLELSIGRDFSIGYQAHSNEKIKFFATESFTFRVLNPDLIVKYNL